MRKERVKELMENRDNFILKLWKTKKYTMQEIGRIFNISTIRIFQILKKQNERLSNTK